MPMDTRNCIILFADLADSVKLYTRLGDSLAKTHIQQLQKILSTEIQAFGGQIQEIIGDELMVRFELVDRALPCSISLHRKAKKYSEQHSLQLSLRIGMHLGAVIEDQGEHRLFGDTVNIAARVTAIAQADQTILTEKLLNAASSSWQTAARRFDLATLKGKENPIVIYDLPWLHDDLTAIVSPTDGTEESACQSLILMHQNQKIDLGDYTGVLSIGRAITNDLVIDADPVSRRHVTIERIHNHFVLSDKSTNGTHLFTHTGQTLYLRRQQWPMSGSGELALGATREHGTDHVIRFDCTGSIATS